MKLFIIHLVNFDVQMKGKKLDMNDLLVVKENVSVVKLKRIYQNTIQINQVQLDYKLIVKIVNVKNLKNGLQLLMDLLKRYITICIIIPKKEQKN
jgi:hypothetical protein